ncbi:hypothetical protein CR513_16345, partial [Mucuna pruriens]
EHETCLFFIFVVPIVIQTIINYLRSLSKTYDNYDHITNCEVCLDNALKVQKAPKGSSSKAFNVEESFNEASKEEGLDRDEFSFISKKIHSMWKKKGGSRWKNYSKKFTKETKDKI